MRIWLPTFIFLIAIAAPILVAAYVLFGFTFAGSTLEFSGDSNAIIALYAVCGVMASFVLATIVTSIVLRFRRKSAPVPEPGPGYTSVLKMVREKQEETADYRTP